MIKSYNERLSINSKLNVYNSLKNAIQFLELKPGARISEPDIAAELGVSRTPVREALIRLSDELLVEIYPQRGTYVSKIDLSLANEMAYMRHIIETEICINMCREKAKIADLVEEKLFMMNLALKRQDIVEYILNDEGFHSAIFSYGNHQMIWNIISSTRAHYIRFLVLDMTQPRGLEESYQDHLKMVECIETGNEEELLKLLNIHHDYNERKREKQIRDTYPEYFV